MSVVNVRMMSVQKDGNQFRTEIRRCEEDNPSSTLHRMLSKSASVSERGFLDITYGIFEDHSNPVNTNVVRLCTDDVIIDWTQTGNGLTISMCRRVVPKGSAHYPEWISDNTIESDLISLTKTRSIKWIRVELMTQRHPNTTFFSDWKQYHHVSGFSQSSELGTNTKWLMREKHLQHDLQNGLSKWMAIQ
jgi:hypothetical protein